MVSGGLAGVDAGFITAGAIVLIGFVSLLADWLKQGDSSTHGLNRDGVVRAGTTNEEFYGYSTQDQHRLGDWWERRHFHSVQA